MAQLMPLPLTVSCFSKIQFGFTFLVPAYPGSPGKRAVKRVCVCVCVHFIVIIHMTMTFFMVLSSWLRAIVRVHLDYLMNADSAPDGCQPSDQVKHVGL